MVPADQRYPVRIPYLQREQEQKRLDREVATIHKIAHEQVVRKRAVAPLLEELTEVVELTVHVTAELEWWRGGARCKVRGGASKVVRTERGRRGWCERQAGQARDRLPRLLRKG